MTKVTDLSREQIFDNLLTGTLWSWFAVSQSRNRLSQTIVNVIEKQGRNDEFFYGLFHAIV
jgi:hypothetical protein